MADYYQLKNQNIFNPPANTSLGNATNQFNDVYVQNELVLGNTAVTGATINTPKVSTITYPGDDTAADPAGGQTITLTGSGFLVGATVLINNIEVSVVSVVSSTTITFTSPANSTGSYVLYVINTDGGTAIAIPGIQYSGTPTWTTAAGSLGSVYETASFNSTVTATGDAPITYSVASGTLPPGATFNSNGTITGTSELLASPTTYTFTVRATDAELQDTNRTFSLTINPDVVTWNSPANGTSYSVSANSAISNVTLNATSAVGSGIAYSANALPDGISLSGNTISGTPTIAANSSSLLTATANTTSESANITINWVISVSNDIYFEYNTLLIPGASTTFVDDASTNNFAITINGDTKPNNFNPYSPGYYSNYFDGTGDWLTIPNNAGFAFGSGAFTVELWVYISGSSGTVANYSNGQSANSNFAWELYQVNTTTMQFSVFEGATQYISSSTSFKQNTWNHIACVRSSNTLTTYVNGVAGATTANITGVTISDPASATLKLCSYGNGSSYVTGYISNFRVVKGTAVYTTAFTPPTSPLTAISGTSLLTCQSNRIIDNSTNNLTITRSGDTTVNSFDPFTPNTSYSTYGSGYFDGTGDYLSVPNNVALQLTGDFTIEFWLYLSGQSGFNQVFVSKFNASSQGYLIYYDEINGKFIFQCTAGSITPSTSFLFKQWTHIAAVRSGNVYTLYINGVSSGTLNSATTATDSGTALEIGRNSANSSNLTIGYISDVRIVKGTAVYTTTFTPPPEPLTAIANTSLLTLQNNQSVNNNVFLDNSTNNLLVTRNGNTTQGTFSPYGGNWSNYFDGSGDYLSLASNAAFNQNTAFTVECWVNSSAGGYFFTQLNSGYLGLNYDASTKKIVVDKSYVGTLFESTNSFAFNQWHHVAMSFDGTNTRLFVNGVLEGTGSGGGSASGAELRIGNYNTGSNFYTGYISNLRISNSALYTSAFTPGTTPLTSSTTTTLLTCQSNRLIDNSINNFTITKGGDTSVQRFSPFNPSTVTATSYSGYFDGTGDYLTATYPINWSSYGSFTAEFWFYTSTIAATNFTFLSTGSTNYTNFYMYGSSGAYPGAIAIGIAGVNEIRSANSVITANAWYHVAYTFNGTTTKIYVNGVEVASSTTNVYSNNSANLTIANGLSNNYMLGYMSNLRLVQGTVVYTSAFTPPTTPLTAISGTKLLTCQSPTFIDNSTNNYTITAFGNSQPSIQNPFGYTSATTQGYSVSTIGGSGYFDGTGDYLQIPNTTSVVMGTGAFTAEAWVYPLVSDTWQGVISSLPSSGTGFGFNITNTNKVRFSIGNGGAGTDLDSTANVLKNTWSHIAITRNSGGTMSLFINGVLQGTATSTANITNTECIIGRGYTNLDVNLLNGYLSDARVIKGQELYTSNFVPPSSPLTSVQNTTLLTNMTSAGVYDVSMMNDMETVGDAKLSTVVTKFGGSSMYFDGTGDGLFARSTVNMSFGTGDFTVEFWINLAANLGSFVKIVQMGTTGNCLTLETQSTTNVLNVTNYTSDVYLASNTALTTSTWIHVAVTRASGTLRIFQNGTGTGSVSNSTDFSNSGGIYIGQSSTGQAINGYLDDLRITKGYARYTSNFTPPTSAFPLY